MENSHKHQKILIICGCLIFLWYLISTVATLYSYFIDSTQTSRRGFTVEVINGHKMVTEISPDGPATALRMHDEVMEVKTPLADKMAPESKSWWRVPPDTKYMVQVKREERMMEIPLQTARRPIEDWLVEGIIRSATKLICLIIALTIFLLRTNDHRAWLLALMLAMLAGIMQVRIESLPEWFAYLAKVTRITAILFLPLIVHFFLVFPEPCEYLRRYPRLLWPIYLIFLAIVAPWFAMSELRGLAFYYHPQQIPFQWFARQQWYRIISMATATAYMALSLAALIINYRAASVEARRKLRVIIVGSGIGFLNIFIQPVLEFLGLQQKFLQLYNALDMATLFTFPLIPLSFAYAIIRHKVIPISLIIRRSVRYILVSRGSVLLVLGGTCLVMLFVMEAFFRWLNPMSGRTVGIISGITGIIIWQIATTIQRTWVAPMIDRRFFRESYDAQQILTDLAESVRNTTDIHQLFEQVGTQIQRALHIENFNVFLRSGPSGDFIQTTNSTPDEKLPIASESELIRQISHFHKPLEFDFSANGNSMEPLLARLRTALILPLATKDRLHGFMTLGSRLGDVPFSNEDEKLLMSVADRTALALENTRLIEQAMQQERRQQELEAENDQRAKELEEARQLQLSMLPKKVPQLPNFEIAAYMKTATEVGGDYYDFHVSSDDSITIAIGDATGHGLRAGMLVTATKGLFNNLARQPMLPDIFSQLSRALKMMNLRSLFMALTMVRIEGRRLSIASAGMPSTLIYRAADKFIEEISIKALPLGGVMNYTYRQKETTLESGDVVLLMSDGFPERFNAFGEMLGYEKALKILSEIAHLHPQKIIDRLVEVGDEWGGSQPQDDDVTFVVLKVK